MVVAVVDAENGEALATQMPKLAVDGSTTKFKNVFDPAIVAERNR